MAELITIDVVYAPTTGEVFHRTLQAPLGITVAQAIEQAGVASAVPGLEVHADRLGVFSRKVALDHRLRDGDRVEIYRPLTLDPKDARRRRARSG